MAQRFLKDELFRLRNHIPINDVIVRVLDLPSKTRDGYLRFLCPICSEFMTACNPKTNLARCFRCERNFNPIDLVMVVKGLNSTLTVNRKNKFFCQLFQDIMRKLYVVPYNIMHNALKNCYIKTYFETFS